MATTTETTTTDPIRLGLPKGRMQENVLKLMNDAGIQVRIFLSLKKISHFFVVALHHKEKKDILKSLCFFGVSNRLD